MPTLQCEGNQARMSSQACGTQSVIFAWPRLSVPGACSSRSGAERDSRVVVEALQMLKSQLADVSSLGSLSAVALPMHGLRNPHLLFLREVDGL